MATQPLQSSLPLSNVDQAFKSVSEYCPLQINGVVIIMRKEDGYINLTKLCQAGEKELRDWNARKKRNLFLEEVSSTVGIPTVELLRQDKGDIHNRHTWGHRRVAINIAQWISPKFENAVTGWVEELLLTGSVTLGQEKTQQELEEAQRKIFELTNINQKQQETIQNLEVYNVSLQRKHRALLQKRKHFRFEEGHCFYLIQDPRIESDRCKFGITSDINLRLKQHRTTWPNLQIRYLVFIDGENECKIIEGGIRRYYEQKRKLETVNHEHIKGVSIDNVIARVEFLLKANCIQYKVDETIEKYNEENKEDIESEDDENTIITTKSGLVQQIESNDNTITQEVENDSDDDLSDAETTVIDKSDIANLNDLNCFQDEEVSEENIEQVQAESSSEDDDDIPEQGTSAMLEAIIKKEKEKETEPQPQTEEEINTPVNNPPIKQKRKQIQIKKVVDGKTVFECAECGKEYSTTQSLYRHHNEIHKDKKIKCTQEGCKATFTRKEALQEHINCVHNKSEFKCTFEGCDMSFKSPSGLKNHVNSQHNKVRYNCSQCEASFSQNVRLREHVKRVHQENAHEAQHKCSFCNKTFARIDGLKLHEAVHTGTSKYVCSKCNKQCTTNQNLQKHLNTCDGVQKVNRNKIKV